MIKVDYTGKNAVVLPYEGKLYRFSPNRSYDVPKGVQAKFNNLLTPVKPDKLKESPKEPDKEVKK